jgi:hypothetical protein
MTTNETAKTPASPRKVKITVEDVTAPVETTPIAKVTAKLTDAFGRAKTEIPTSAKLSKIGYYAGVGSLLFGFPANLIAIISGVAVEDRRRLGGVGNFKKVADKTVLLTDEELTRSRIGLLSGVISLTSGVLVLALRAGKR